jgi:hypothetical protein
MIAFFQKQPFRQTLLKSAVIILGAVVTCVAISLLVLVKRLQRDELHSHIKDLEKNIEVLKENGKTYDIEIDKFKKDTLQIAIALLTDSNLGAIEEVVIGGYVMTRPRRAHPGQITPIYMNIPRFVQPIRGGVSSGPPGDAVLVEETGGRRTP